MNVLTSGPFWKWLTEEWFCCRFSIARTTWGSSKANPRRKPPKTSGSGSKPCRTPGSRWPPWFFPQWLWWWGSSSSLSTLPPGPVPSSRHLAFCSVRTDWLEMTKPKDLPPCSTCKPSLNLSSKCSSVLPAVFQTLCASWWWHQFNGVPV